MTKTMVWMILACLGAPPASALTLGEVQEALSAAPRATWTARPAAHPLVAGALPETGDGQTVVLPPPVPKGATDSGLPAHWDWRDMGAHSYLSEVQAQGSCGACVSFAIVSALEAALNIACDEPERSFQLSRQFHFSCGGGGCQSGLRLSEGMHFLATDGAPDTPCLPYAAAGGADVACSAACADWSSRAVQGITYTQPTAGHIDIVAIKRGLLHGPLVSNVILFEDLQHFGDGVYRHVKGNQIGMHALVLVGWDDKDQAWIARNSWGKAWGQGGYFEIAWDDVSLPGRYTWLIDVTAPKQRGICAYPR